MKEKIKFNKKNIISCQNVSIRRIVWEYICWTLAGKPDGHKWKGEKW